MNEERTKGTGAVPPGSGSTATQPAEAAEAVAPQAPPSEAEAGGRGRRRGRRGGRRHRAAADRPADAARLEPPSEVTLESAGVEAETEALRSRSRRRSGRRRRPAGGQPSGPEMPAATPEAAPRAETSPLQVQPLPPQAELAPPTQAQAEGEQPGAGGAEPPAAEGETSAGEADRPPAEGTAAKSRGRRRRGGRAARREATPEEAVDATAETQAGQTSGEGSSPKASEAPVRPRRGGRRGSVTRESAAEDGMRPSEGGASVSSGEAEADAQASPEPATSAKRPRRRRPAKRAAEAVQTVAKRATAGEASPDGAKGRGVAEPSAETPAPDTRASEDAPQEQPGVAPAQEMEQAGEEKPKKRLRRGRPRRRPAAGETAAEALAGVSSTTESAAAVVEEPPSLEEAPAVQPPKGKEAQEARRRLRLSRRGAAPIERAGAERVILASQDYGELRVVLLEDGRLAEVYFQRPERPSYLGNIYRAKVESVLRGMDAAFVDFGLEKNGFLHVDEVTLRDNGGSRRGKRITQLLQPGQELLVQVTKDPMGSKGARLTTRMSLPGRYLVYVPGGSGVGVSRRLPQEERERLRDVCRELKAKDAGLIVRTVAEGASIEELRRDLQYLARQWSRIRSKAEKTPAPGLVHEEVDVALSVARDLFNESCTRYVVDSERLRKQLVAYIQRVVPELVDRIELHTGEEPLFDAYGIEEQLERTLVRRVTLPSGGNIVIDHAEALTVIDVNSGRFTGGSGLEDTITRTNLEAAAEVVKQLRLRDIGGIIVIDFIDMERAENRTSVLGKLEAELATDRTKTYVVEISPLGLVEMTRQNTTDGARGILTKGCPYCGGTARVLSEDTVARRAERRLRALARSTHAAALLVEVNAAVAQRLDGSDRLRKLERDTGKRFLLQGSRTLPIDAFDVIATGTVPEIEAQRIPVTEGMELDVEIEHSLTFSPRDALAVINGYPVMVRGARQYLGTRRRVRVETALRSGGTAVSTGPAATS